LSEGSREFGFEDLLLELQISNIVIASEARQTSKIEHYTGLPRFARNDDVKR